MKVIHLAAWLPCFLLLACQPAFPNHVTILEGGQAYTLESPERVPLNLLTQAGIAVQPFDRVLFNGMLLPLDQPLPDASFVQLQLRHAMPLTIQTPEGQQVIISAALTVGKALSEAGYSILAGDLVDPPLSTSITTPLTIQVTPAQELTIYIGDDVIHIRSAAGTVGAALAEGEIPLTGLDISSPLENEPLPSDGQIRVTRVNEVMNSASSQFHLPPKELNQKICHWARRI
jgi:uncharacterized protein YabE (DUF348 family)